MRRPLLLLALPALVGLVATAPARADTPPPDPVIAAGVTVAGFDVAGLTRPEALAAVRAWFARPVVLFFRGRRVLAHPSRDLRTRAPIAVAVQRAMAAAPGTRVALRPTISRYHVRRYVRGLARRFDRKQRDSRLFLRKLRPFITKARSGRLVVRPRLRIAIRTALWEHRRGPITITRKTVRPRLTRRSFGPIVVIRRGSKRLYLYRNMRFVRRFGVATGMPQYPTPTGRFTIVTKQRNPWWYPPDEDWANGAEPIPPGPGNPLGTRWMGLSIGGVGIHGTPDAASIGYSASHGCIRMRIPDAEWLFRRVRLGTTVFIVRR
jgi:L,D-transpeptidase catalytic domain